jgi:hypothetical protein
MTRYGSSRARRALHAVTSVINDLWLADEAAFIYEDLLGARASTSLGP